LDNQIKEEIMKKRIMSLGVVAVLAALLAMGCGVNKATETTSGETASEDYQYVSAAETVEIAKSGSGHVLDVREWSNYVEGRVVNSEWCPIFPLEEVSLAEDMTTYAEKYLNDGESIYIICNSGQRGAVKTTEVLIEAGIDTSLIYTVEGGVKALAEEKDALTANRAEESIDWQEVTAEETLENRDAQVIDVRDDKNYAEGHLADSIHQDLTEIEDPAAQTAMYDLAGKELDQSKPVYFLCYSGNKCAKTAISVLKDAGFDVENLFIIEQGAKNSVIKEAFVSN